MDLLAAKGSGALETAAEHRPVYLRVSQAERVRAEKGNGQDPRKVEDGQNG